jgi:hypothetical protein
MTSVNLKDLVNNSPDYVDNTEGIRSQKHSVPIRDDLRIIDKLRADHLRLGHFNQEVFANECRSKCEFLFNNYTDIFNRAVANELDYVIMTKILSVLKLIEDGKVDQNDGSVLVGQLLKELYVDSAVKRADNLDKIHSAEEEPVVESKKISWKEFKNKSK